MSYLRYLCLFTYSDVFVLFFFVLCILCCQFLWIALSPWYSYIYILKSDKSLARKGNFLRNLLYQQKNHYNNFTAQT